MKLIVFGGFLGSGKTSLILSFARYLVEKCGKQTIVGNTQDNEAGGTETSLVIIENEIGSMGIDNKIIKKLGFEVKELFSGCICCQLGTDLIAELKSIYENINPEWVIIEATGLAYPGKVTEMVGKYCKGIDAVNVITVVDVERWRKLLRVTPFIMKQQVEDAGIVLVNKVDLADNEITEKIECDIMEINPKARFFRTNAKDIMAEEFWTKVVHTFE